MDLINSPKTNNYVVDQIKTYWLYILSVLLVVIYCCYSNMKKIVKKTMKGG